MSNYILPQTNFWIAPETQLIGTRVRLLPLRYEYLEPLVNLGNDPRIWTHFPADRTNPATRYNHLVHCFMEMKCGNQHAFCIQTAQTGKIAGLTRLFHLDQANRQLEIGSWLHPDFWRTGINTEAKYLLLRFCFVQLKTIRVQFRTDATNLRSRQALEKMGATFEGIIRNERIRDDGSTRDAAFYSILDSEWFDRLENRFKERLCV